jgi:hypothetical protein
MLACDDPTHNPKRDVDKVPAGFEKALSETISIVLRWASEHKAPDCLPVFCRMNIGRDQFRVHIVPASPEESAKASESLAERIPDLKDEPGGFLHYLGEREDDADKQVAAFNKVKDDEEATRRLMKEGGIPVIVEQLQACEAARRGAQSTEKRP